MRRIRRRGVEFARKRGIVISNVRIGPAGHEHPCRCGPCSVCTCRTCVSYLSTLLAVKQYASCNPESEPCGCRTYLGALVCPVCESYGALCYGPGSLCCIRCASIFARSYQRECMRVPVEIANARTLVNTEQAIEQDITSISSAIESPTILGPIPRVDLVTKRLTAEFKQVVNNASRIATCTRSDTPIVRLSRQPACGYRFGSAGFGVGTYMSVQPLSRRTRVGPGSSSDVISFDLPSACDTDLSSDEFIPDLTGYGPRRLPEGILGRGVNKNPIGVRRLHTLYGDEVMRRDNELEKCDKELLWYLRTQAALMTRDSELALKLKRKAEAWVRANRSDWKEVDRHYAMAQAINNAVLDNQIDRGYRTVLRRQDPLQIEVFNRFIAGEVVPPRTGWNKFVRWLGFRKTADRWWRETGYVVFPKTT